MEPGSDPLGGGDPHALPLAPRLRRAQLLFRIGLRTCIQVTGKPSTHQSIIVSILANICIFTASRSDNDIIGDLHARVSALEESEAALRDTYGSPYR